MIDLELNKVLDIDENINAFNLRESLKVVEEGLNDNLMYSFNGRIITVSADKAYSNLALTHNLGFIPKDIVVTSVIPSSATVIVKSEKSSKKSISLDISAKCDIRLLVGVFE